MRSFFSFKKADSVIFSILRCSCFTFFLYIVHTVTVPRPIGTDIILRDRARERLFVFVCLTLKEKYTHTSHSNLTTGSVY